MTTKPVPKTVADFGNPTFDVPEGFDALGYCDGACSGNPGPGGWGAVLGHRDMDGSVYLASGRPDGPTTNNQMELTAAIELLGMTAPGERVLVRTDSQYVIKGNTEWRRGWQSRGMRNSKGEAVANAALWKQLWALVDVRHVRWEWVRGHNGDLGNELADKLATEAIRR